MTQRLLEHGYHLGQIRLVGHHFLEVLVSAGDLVQDTGILAALDSGGLRGEVGQRFLAGPSLGPQ